MPSTTLQHKYISKGNQRAAFGAANHARYILRPQALTAVVASGMPTERRHCAKWLRVEERGARKNARMIEKVMVGLPRELTPEQMQALVTGFATAVARGKAPWLAAFHLEPENKDKPDWNPHCHLIFRDKDPETGKRVMFFTAGRKETAQYLQKRGQVALDIKALRMLWQDHQNAALEAAGRAERVDLRSLKAQGRGEAPTIHEGVKGRHAAGKGPLISEIRVHQPTMWTRPDGVTVWRRKGPTASRTIDYPAIDKGQPRSSYNATVQQERFVADHAWSKAAQKSVSDYSDKVLQAILDTRLTAGEQAILTLAQQQGRAEEGESLILKARAQRMTGTAIEQDRKARELARQADLERARQTRLDLDRSRERDR
jgi:hypothetical protein